MVGRYYVEVGGEFEDDNQNCLGYLIFIRRAVDVVTQKPAKPVDDLSMTGRMTQERRQERYAMTCKIKYWLQTPDTHPIALYGNTFPRLQQFEQVSLKSGVRWTSQI